MMLGGLPSSIILTRAIVYEKSRTPKAVVGWVDFKLVAKG
jgi:hypothetical protein